MERVVNVKYRAVRCGCVGSARQEVIQTNRQNVNSRSDNSSVLLADFSELLPGQRSPGSCCCEREKQQNLSGWSLQWVLQEKVFFVPACWIRHCKNKLWVTGVRLGTIGSAWTIWAVVVCVRDPEDPRLFNTWEFENVSRRETQRMFLDSYRVEKKTCWWEKFLKK